MKCCNHPDKEASAVCERCNTFYCGNCVLSSNGKCPKCGNLLRSPQNVLPYEINQEEIYKGKGQPHLLEAVDAIYMEPQRAMRRIKEYSSLITSTTHLSMLYLAMFIIWTVALVIVALIPETFGVSPPNLFDVRNIFTFLLVNVIYFGVFIFMWMFSSFLFFLPSKLLGGKGTYVQQASLLAYIMVAVFPLGFLAVLTVAIPAVGPIITFVAITLVFIFSFYLVFLSVREVNQFKTVKALASFVISLAIFVFIAILTAGISVLILALLGNLPQPSF